METYQWKANSNAAPFFSDSSEGFINAESPMEALHKVVAGYTHPCGLFAATISLPTPENPVVARYLSARAATAEEAPSGLTKWVGDILYVDEIEIPASKEIYEKVK